MRPTVLALAALIAAALPAGAQVQDSRDSASRLAVALLGKGCLLTLGDKGAQKSAVLPGNDFGLGPVPPEVAQTFLNGATGVVGEVRTPDRGTLVLVARDDGKCSVYAQWADFDAMDRYLSAMVEQGGLRGGGTLTVAGTKVQGKDSVRDYVLAPDGWLAKTLAGRFGGDGRKPVLITVTGSPPGSRPMEGVLSAWRP